MSGSQAAFYQTAGIPYQAWIPPDPQPTLPPLDAGISLPVTLVFNRAWLSTVLAAWVPPDPPPTLNTNDGAISPASVLTRVFGGNKWLATVLDAWTPPPPLPTFPIFLDRVTPGGPPLPPKPIPGSQAIPPHNVNAFGAIPVYVVPNNAFGAIQPKAGTGTVISIAGSAIVAVVGPVNGGYITNPANASAQGISVAENAYVDMVGSPGATDALANGTTVLLTPAQSFTIPAIGAGVTVLVNAATAGHKLTVVVW